jgi:transposase
MKGFPCPVDRLEWIDSNNNSCSIDTHTRSVSKGLFEICKELRLIPADAQSSQFHLPKLVELASSHPAFESQTLLEELASEYNVRIVYLPKFHCELSPIEGVWAHEKQFIRKHTDQSFEALRKLLVKSRDNLKTHYLIPKLWRRYWRTVEAYKRGENFLTILSNYFGVKCKVDVAGHRAIQPHIRSNVSM